MERMDDINNTVFSNVIKAYIETNNNVNAAIKSASEQLGEYNIPGEAVLEYLNDILDSDTA